MKTSEKRRVERYNNVLIVNFRQLRKTCGYLLGITSNYSSQGVSFETERLEYNPGEVLELILRHPYSDCSVPVAGEIVWKTDSWYKCTTGIKLIGLDQDADNKMKDLMKNTMMTCEERTTPEQKAEQPQREVKDAAFVSESVLDAGIVRPHEQTSTISNEEAEREDIVISESVPEDEPVVFHEHISSVSKEGEEREDMITSGTGLDAGIIQPHEDEEVELPDGDADRNKSRYRTDKIPVMNIFIGLLLAASAVVAVTVLFALPENNKKKDEQELPRNTAVIQQPTVKKGNEGPVREKNDVSPVINTVVMSDVLTNAEKPVPSQNSAALRETGPQKHEIIFDSDSDLISPQYRSLIDKYVASALRDPRALLRIEGYADSIGPELYNLDLAMRRALEVKKLLMKKGIDDRRMKVIVYGESYPESSPEDEFDNAADRRVDMIIIPSGPASVAP